MLKVIDNTLYSSYYIPHGHCYLWQTPLVGLHALSDTLIALAYYSIPLMLIHFIRHREDVPFRRIFLLFSAFIILCGTTHLLEVVTLWFSWYWLSGIVKMATALISIYTAFALYPIIPIALTMPSPLELEKLNQNLAKEIQERILAQNQIIELNIELENRVEERTKELKQANLNLEKSKHFTQKIVESTPHILYIYDLENNQNIYSSKFIEDVLGYSVESLKLIGNVNNIIHHEDQPIVAKHLEKCRFLTSESFLECDYRMKDLYDNWHWIHSRDRAFEYNNEGQVIQILGVASDITKRKEVELEMNNLNHQLAERINELEINNQDMIYLGKVNDFFLSCSKLEEAINVLADLIQPIFPDTTGAVFMLNAQNNQLEKVAFWGNEKYIAMSLETQDCWAIRRGNFYSANHNYPSLFCQHFHDTSLPKISLCIPLTAQGKTMGLFLLCYEKRDVFSRQKISLAETVSKQIALAFANISLQEDLQNQSWRDGLTGLYNRRYLEHYLSQEIKRAERNNYCLGIVMIDLDYFKAFNDNYGHQAGDRILQELSLFLQNNIREYDVACRYGGEELTLILSQVSQENLYERVDDLRVKIKQLGFYYEGKNLGKITISAGISMFPEHGKQDNILLKKADQALYQAKEAGRNQVKMFSET